MSYLVHVDSKMDSLRSHDDRWLFTQKACGTVDVMTHDIDHDPTPNSTSSRRLRLDEAMFRAPRRFDSMSVFRVILLPEVAESTELSLDD